MRLRVYIGLMLLASCSSMEQSQKKELRQKNERKDRVHRLSHEMQYPKTKLLSQIRDPYPWELGFSGIHPKITKESFRCKGDEKNPSKSKEKDANCILKDCGGIRNHSLPVRGKQEFIYPILLDLLNYIQVKTGCQVVITCGHRCPLHHAYADSSLYHANSKHMMGAEVDFYVKGMEEKPQEISKIIMQYYKEQECYKGQPEYEKFSKLDSIKVDVSTVPLYNKEILIKIYQKEEGRDFDNSHSYPYISLQVRFDRERNEKVTYSSEKAFNGYMRY